MSNSLASRARIAVVGGGITGLAAAYTVAKARRAGAPVEESLIEGCDSLGGVIRTEHVEGFVIEAGPDSFLAEKPEAAALCRELALGDALLGSNDSERRTYILHCGRLVPLPDGLMLLVPTRLWPMATTRLLPLRSKLSIAAEWFALPPRDNQAQSGDESVASFVQRHFGEAMVDNIVDPLLAGVYGGDSRQLSIRSVLPRFWEMERKYGSLTRATLRARRDRLSRIRKAKQGGDAQRGDSLPLFMTLKGGLAQMIEALTAQLASSRIHLATRVSSIQPAASPAGNYRITCDDGSAREADAVVLAMPAHECARLFAPISAFLANLLNGISYSSSMTVSLAYNGAARAALPPGFGFLVPRKENRRLLASTFVHGKFNHRVPPGKALVRCFLGGAGDADVLNLSDREVITLVRKELQTILNFDPEPLFYRIHRWPASMPQYVVGHQARVAAIQKGLEGLPGLFLAGNAYGGIGISDCVRSGKAAAEGALQFLSGRSPR